MFGYCFGQHDDYKLILFNKADGLGQDYVYSLVQDDRNFLWIGTGNGIARYDGRNIDNFNTSDGIQNNFITASALDENGNVIFGHYNGGFTWFNGHNFKPIKLEGIDAKIVSIKTSYSQEYGWAITQNGILIKLKGQHLTDIRKDILKDKLINCLAFNDNQIYVGTNEGLVVFDVYQDGQLSEGKMPASLEWINVTALDKKKNTLWIGTEGSGIFKIIKNNDPIQVTKDGLNKFYISALKIIENDLWVGTKRNGVYVISFKGNEEIIRDFNDQNNYPRSINEIFEDEEGSVWLGSTGEGLIQLVQNQFTYYNLSEKFSNKNITGGLLLSEGEYLFSTDAGIISANYDRFKSRYSFNYHKSKELALLEANFIDYDDDSLVWLSTNDGRAYTFNNRNQELKSLKLNIKESVKIRSISKDSKGNTWISVEGQGVFKLDPSLKITEHLNTSTGFIHNEIFAIHIDRDDNVWFGAKAAGLAVLRSDGQVDRLSQTEIFPSRDINDIIGDNDGNVWISTDGDGIFEYDGNSFSHFTTESGLKSMYCGKMVVDTNNNVWVTHRGGISQVNQANHYKIYTYDESHGMYSDDTYYQTLLSDFAGGVWFSSQYEIIRYNVLSDISKYKSPPFISGLRIFYEKTDLTRYTDQEEYEGMLPENITLPHNQNHLTFDFISVSLKSRNNMYYKHWLEGYETKWSPPLHENSATYTNLAPGRYKLLVAASDNQYVWPEEHIVKYEFSILKPYWNRWWFYALQMMFFIALIIITYQVSIKSETNKSKWILRILVYVCLFIMFEFLQNFLEPYVKNYVGGAPVFRILINLILALMLFPIEGLIKTFFYDKANNMTDKKAVIDAIKNDSD